MWMLFSQQQMSCLLSSVSRRMVQHTCVQVAGSQLQVVHIHGDACQLRTDWLLLQLPAVVEVVIVIASLGSMIRPNICTVHLAGRPHSTHEVSRYVE